ncbi:MAG: response regulator transcription factor [Kiritimatiellaceae bacterium]|nr:response regulator transcription factor [Kiritimatiellaceae bacterium]
MNIVIVEDNALTRRILELTLKREGGFESIEVFDSAEQALEKANWADTEILLTDINLCVMSGVDLIKWVQQNHPHIDSMAHTFQDSGDMVFSTILAGASGYQVKGEKPYHLAEALVTMREGGIPISPSVAGKIIDLMLSEDPDRGISFNSFSEVEKQILLMVRKGYSYQDIAYNMDLSIQCIHEHVRSVFATIRNKIAC